MSKSLHLAALLFFIIQHSLFSQHDVFIGGNMDLGVPFQNSYLQNKSVLKSKFTLCSQYTFSAQYRFANRIGIEAGVGQSFYKSKFRDQNFESRHKGYELSLKNKNAYYSYFANLILLQPLSDEVFLYGTFGYSTNIIGSQSLNTSKEFTIDNEKITANAGYPARNNSYTAEIGIQTIINDASLLSFGLKLNYGNSPIYTEHYTTSGVNGVIKQDRFTTKGSFIGLSVGYKYRIFHADKRHKVKKPPVVHDNRKKVEGRDLNVISRMTVTKKTITVKVWDHEKIDGDIISINVNGKWVLQKYTLKKEPYVFTVELLPGTNYFVLHALNLGHNPPNTAAILIDDGTHKNQIILESDLKQSGAIEIQYQGN